MAETTRKSAAQKAAEVRAGQEPAETQEERDAQAREVAQAAAPASGTDRAETPAMNVPPAGFLADEPEADGKVLTASTHVRHPQTGELEFLEVGSQLPEWAQGQDADGNPLVGDHLLAEPGYGRDPSVLVPLDGSQPPAKDATRPRWAAYAAAHGVVVGGSAGILEIKEALDASGVPVE